MHARTVHCAHLCVHAECPALQEPMRARRASPYAPLQVHVEGVPLRFSSYACAKHAPLRFSSDAHVQGMLSLYPPCADYEAHPLPWTDFEACPLRALLSASVEAHALCFPKRQSLKCAELKLLKCPMPCMQAICIQVFELVYKELNSRRVI